MTEMPDFLLRGTEATLFPVLAETSKEKRVTSIFLAVMSQVPIIAQEVLGSVGQKVGKRTRMSVFTEVTLKADLDKSCRPDGLILLDTGRATWSALIESKIGRAKLDDDQVKRYVELAKANGIDAVITISNQIVTGADHSPCTIPKQMLRKVSLHHWSWAWLSTVCEIAALQERVEGSEQNFLLRQLRAFLAHPATGVERFTQMSESWKGVVQAVANGETLKKSSPEVEAAAASWLTEERDLCLHLSTYLAMGIDVVVERKLRDDPAAKLKAHVENLVQGHALRTTLRIPDCASDLDIRADLARKSLSASMQVKAPIDRKSTKARVNWLLRMLPKDDPNLSVRAMWPGRAAPTLQPLSVLRDDPECIQGENRDLAPHTFEVIYNESLAARFSGRRTFIEDLERIVPRFYELVGAHLKAWQAPPPKPVQVTGARVAGTDDPTEDTLLGTYVQERISGDTEGGSVLPTAEDIS